MKPLPVQRTLKTRSACPAWRPAVDIYDTDNAIVIKAELPGIKKDDVSIDVKGNVLTIKGERSFDKETKEETTEKKGVSVNSKGLLLCRKR